VLRFVRKVQRVAPRGPAFPGKQARLDPFGQFGQSGERLFYQRRHARLGQSFGQRIDRLVELREAGTAVLRNMIGMNDLEHVAVTLKLARHPALLANGQLLLRGERGAAKEGQRADIADPVLREHAVRPAIAARGAMFGRGQRDDDLLAFDRIVERFDRAPRHEAFGQMIGYVLDPRQAQLFERPAQLGTYAIQRVCLDKERIESFGPHWRSLTAFSPPAKT